MNDNLTTNAFKEAESPAFLVGAVIRWFFILCGGQLYMNWVLITNPTSKNPLIKFIYGWNKKAYCGFNYKNRLQLACLLGSIHIIGAIIMAFCGGFLSITNILVNIYPIIVQFYIGWRCWRIKNLRITALG